MVNEHYQIKDLKIVLKDFETIVKTGDKYGRLWLIDGSNLEKKSDNIPLECGGKFQMRYREAWGNWLLCATLNYIHGIDLTFTDNEDCDGIILDKKTGSWIVTEHVAAMNFPNGKKLPQGEERIISAIKHKIGKGEVYAKGKYLVVFSDGAGKWYPNKVGKAIANNHYFEAIYCIALVNSNDKGYIYSVSQLLINHSPTFLVKINSDFTNWTVERFQ